MREFPLEAWLGFDNPPETGALMCSGRKVCVKPLFHLIFTSLVQLPPAACPTMRCAPAGPRRRSADAAVRRASTIRITGRLVLVVIYSAFWTVAQVRALVLGWAALAAVSGLCGVVQFALVRREAFAENANDYEFFLYHRITGFASHWMTFGGQEMIVLLVVAALLLFSRERRWRVSCIVAAAIILLAMALGLTRSVLLAGLPAGAAYLVWQWKKWLLPAVPALAIAAFLAAPFQVRERVASAVRPHPQYDSNVQRLIMARTGWAMIKAHPWFGVGPEQIAPQFDHYVPADIPRPLPQGWYGHLHNIYLQYAAERGVFGVAAVLWFIGTALSDFARWLRVAAP